MTSFLGNLERFDDAPAPRLRNDNAEGGAIGFGAVPVVAAEPQPDPEAEVRARAEALSKEIADRSARLDALARSIEKALAQANADRAQERAEIAKSVADAVATLLPGLREHFAASDLAAACHAIIRQRGNQDAALHLPLETDDALADEIAARLGQSTASIVLDPTLPAGMASLRWPDGGADVDANALITAARDHLVALTHHHQRSRTAHG